MEGIRLHIFFLAINLSLVLGGLLDSVKYEIKNGVHAMKRGERQPGDEKLFHDMPNEKGQMFPPKHVGNEYCYPPLSSMQPIKITSYEVKDLDRGNNGGVAFDVSGGVGQSQVCVFLKTQYAGSYHYEIDVYGYKLDSNGQIIRNNMGGNNMVGMGVGSMGGMMFGSMGGFGASNYPPAGGIGGAFGNNNAGGHGGYNNGDNGYGNSGSGYGSGGSGYGSGGFGYSSSGSGYGSGSPRLGQGTNRYSPGNERY